MRGAQQQFTILSSSEGTTIICQITGTGNSAKSLACSSTCRLFCQRMITGTGTSAKSLAQAILSNHWHTVPTDRQFYQMAILPNHWHTPPRMGYSAKSLAHCLQTDNSAKSMAQAILPNQWQSQFCQITGTLLHIQAILPNHWHTVYRQTILPNHCLTGTLSTERQFCQITGTDNSAKSLACSSTCRLFSAKSLAQPILPDHWHAPPHTGNSAKSLAHCPSWRSLATTVILPNHWHRQFCQITGMLVHM
jgi:hypothetical protein